GLSPKLRPETRTHGWHAGLHHFGDECAVCLFEVRETVGNEQATSNFELRSSKLGMSAIRSVHIDTARTWRGGQNQVLLTVTGLEAAGHPAVLVAHESGELKRRAWEGLR